MYAERLTENHRTMKRTLLILMVLLSAAFVQLRAQTQPMRSIRDFGVLPENTPQQNAENLQRAIDWAAGSGAALFVEPSDDIENC